MPLSNPILPSEKTLELIVYIASKLKDKPNYGAILLNKALYHIDGFSYLVSGKPISEFKYVRQGKGPTPKPAQFLAARDHLEKKNKLKKVELPYYNFIQKKYISDASPKIELFSKEEIEIINSVLLYLGDVTASDISDQTHNYLSWRLAIQMEELPVYTFLLGSSGAQLHDYAWAEDTIARFETKSA